jgi:hypothetical protein
MRCNRGNNKIHLFPATSEIRGIIGGEEAARIALRKRGKPFCGACKKLGHTRASKRCEKYRRK